MKAISRTEFGEVYISDCVHFRGFRYGGYGNNIYEDYIIGLRNNRTLTKIREQFIRRVIALRNNTFGEALGIDLGRAYPAWLYPWDISSVMRFKFSEWTPERNPDIVCHFSAGGVLASHINREFFWLERAYSTMNLGYDPSRLGYITVLQLSGPETSRYLVLDGNHRIAALHSLGRHKVLVRVVRRALVSVYAMRIWPGVVAGKFLSEDSRQIFNRYFLEDNLSLSELTAQKILFDEPLLAEKPAYDNESA